MECHHQEMTQGNPTTSGRPMRPVTGRPSSIFDSTSGWREIGGLVNDARYAGETSGEEAGSMNENVARAIRRDLGPALATWREILRGNPVRARQLLRKIIAEPIGMEPLPECKGYRWMGTLNGGAVLTGAQKTVSGPGARTHKTATRSCSERKALEKWGRNESADWRSVLHNYGAGGGNRTLMGQAPRDFESRASTSFTTPAIFTIN